MTTLGLKISDPKIAIIGRPNVGKSTLFNRLVGRRLALVDDQPGVTRDRREAEAQLGDLLFTLIDTAGLEEGTPESLQGRMRAQTEAAILQADVILFLIDARTGITPTDRWFASLIRRAGKPILLIANKAEGRQGDAGIYEAFSLGFGDPLPLSAEHNEGIGELYYALTDILSAPSSPTEKIEQEERDIFSETYKDMSFTESADFNNMQDTALPEDNLEEEKTELDLSKPLRIAVVGRPNAGKSTLINNILGEERLLTGPEAGLTRDSISVSFTWAGRALKIFDTAGLRRKAKIVEKLEKLAVSDAIRAIQFAEVVILLLDATIPFEKQDLSIAHLVAKEGRALVIGLNKWDLINPQHTSLAALKEQADRLLPQLRGMAVVPISGLQGTGIANLIKATMEAQFIWNKRISTGRLNRWLTPLLEHTPPPAVSGRRIKIRYITQAKTRPPHFVLFGNQLENLPTSYERFLINGLRNIFQLPGTPIRITKRQTRNPFS